MPRQPPAPPYPPLSPGRLDPKIWRACAGGSVQIPALGSRVYYFPQGHFDHASSPPQHLSPLLLSRPVIPCLIAAVEFLADPLTDEVFVKLQLNPITAASPPQLFPAAGENNGENCDDDKVVSFAKILTASDANNGGGFSVPRFCADSIFPPLDFEADPPVQTLSITDVHGVSWDFRHIYRGTPRRHLLTTGWSKFVNSKKLVAGDSAVFMKNSRGEMFIGIRRTQRFDANGGGGGTQWLAQLGAVRNVVEEEPPVEEERNINEVFSRNGKGKLPVKAVVEAAELAAQDLPFEVVFYPRAGFSEFVVKAEIVDGAMSLLWGPGMKVKMAMDTEDSSRMAWFQGVVAMVHFPEHGYWNRSPWRMLQISWDEPEVLQNAKWVSPWQVQHVTTTHALHTIFPPAKKFRPALCSGVLTDGEGDNFSMTGFPNSTMGDLSQTLLSYSTFPVGMQGARHDLFSASSFSSHNPRLGMGNSSGNKAVPMLRTSSTKPNIANSQSDDSSPQSHSSLLPLPESKSLSVKLFGVTIQGNQPVENDSHVTGCTAHNSTEGCNENNSADNPMENSLNYPEFIDRRQCQRASTLELHYYL